MMNQKQRDELLIRIDERLKLFDERFDEINEALSKDYKILHGNGKPGLLERVQTLEDFHRNENSFLKKIANIIAWGITTAIAIYSVIKHHY